MSLSLTISPKGDHLAIRKRLWLVMLSIVLMTPPITASAVPPCLIATIRVSLKFGALEERFYIQRIWLQILKTLKEENNIVREFLRCEEIGINATCFSFRI
jgi:hypothetical protein